MIEYRRVLLFSPFLVETQRNGVFLRYHTLKAILVPLASSSLTKNYQANKSGGSKRRPPTKINLYYNERRNTRQNHEDQLLAVFVYVCVSVCAHVYVSV